MALSNCFKLRERDRSNSGSIFLAPKHGVTDTSKPSKYCDGRRVTALRVARVVDGKSDSLICRPS
jgi:hypothetical protein